MNQKQIYISAGNQQCSLTKKDVYNYCNAYVNT